MISIIFLSTVYGSFGTSLSGYQAQAWDTEELKEQLLYSIHKNDAKGEYLLELLRQKAEDEENTALLIDYTDMMVKYFRQKSEFDKGLQLINELLGLKLEFLREESIANIELRKIPLFIELNRLSEAEGSLKKLSGLGLDRESTSFLFKFKGDIEQAKGNYDKALTLYLEVLKQLHENSENLSLRASVYNNLGNTSHLLGRYDEAIAYYKSSMKIHEELGDELQRVIVIANMGGTLRALGKKREALAHYQNAYESAKALSVPDVIAQYLVNMGNIYTDLGNYDRALDQFNESLEICKAHGIDYGVALNHLNMGYTFYNLQQYDKALAAYDEAMRLSEEYDLKYEKRQLFENYAELYRDRGQFDLAFRYLDKFVEIHDELLNEERIAVTEEAQAKYETELKDVRLQQQQALLEGERMKVMMLIGAIIVGIFVILAGVFLYRARITRLQEQFERLKNERLLATAENRERTNVLNGNRGDIQNGRDENVEQGKGKNGQHLFELYRQIQKEFNESKVYTDPNLTLEDLSEAVSSNTSYVSKAIRLYADSNFNGLVNYYRIKKATDILYSEREKISVFELMERCGFASKSSFYRWFKKNTGMTPDQFRNLVHKDTKDINCQPEG
ncbi:MAG: tetratricopeptide repeat protein [Balneolaceae bacterium]|nr:tetratricopeptide repeat protein [Balneolaceae bacterium]